GISRRAGLLAAPRGSRGPARLVGHAPEGPDATMTPGAVRGAIPSATAERLVLGSLLLLATSNRPLRTLAGLTFRLDLAGGALAAGIVFLAVATGRRLPTNAALVGLGGFVAAQVLSSVANRAVWPQGVKFSFLYVLGLASTAVVLILVRDMETAR